MLHLGVPRGVSTRPSTKTRQSPVRPGLVEAIEQRSASRSANVRSGESETTSRTRRRDMSGGSSPCCRAPVRCRGHEREAATIRYLLSRLSVVINYCTVLILICTVTATVTVPTINYRTTENVIVWQYRRHRPRARHRPAARRFRFANACVWKLFETGCAHASHMYVLSNMHTFAAALRPRLFASILEQALVARPCRSAPLDNATIDVGVPKLHFRTV